MSISFFQVIIIPIWRKADEQAGVLNAASSVAEVLKSASIKVQLDDSDQRTPGWKFNFWEMKVCTPRSSINPCITSTQLIKALKSQLSNHILFYGAGSRRANYFWVFLLFYGTNPASISSKC